MNLSPSTNLHSRVLYSDVPNASCYTHSGVFVKKKKNLCIQFSIKINRINLSFTCLLEYEALVQYIFIAHKNTNVFRTLINN